jgi:excisionase family DNA binding protein
MGAKVAVGTLERRPFFTVDALAAYLSLSRRTANRLLDEGEIASYKIGALRRIDPVDVDAWLARHREEGRRAA